MNICTEGQGFAQNLNPSYKAAQLAGHSGVDVSCGWHSPIYSLYDGYVYKVLTPEKPANDGSGFTGIFMIVDDGMECFEWLVGHCDPMIPEGTYVKKGDLMGYEANHGQVYAGNIEITLAMQKAGDQRGHHRHYQKRPVQKVQTTLSQFPCLSATNSDGGGTYRDESGNYYEIWSYNNYEHGCVDPTAPVFNRTLSVGSSGYDVFVLQRILARYGYFDQEPTGYFGGFTLAGVFQYQWAKATGLAPVVGPKTRAAFNAEVQPLPDLFN